MTMSKSKLPVPKEQIIDFERKGNVIRFYLGTNGKQWGDDWNDVPYECNAGRVYDEYVTGIEDISIPFDCLVLEPADGCLNSKFSKEDMIRGQIPCVIIVPKSFVEQVSWGLDDFAFWIGNNNIIKVYFGADIDVIKKEIEGLCNE